MPSLEDVLKVLRDYGVGGVVLIVFIYMVLNSEILFRYGHKRRKDKKDSSQK
jgi:hypothetical protein